MSKCTPTNRLPRSMHAPLSEVDSLLSHFFPTAPRDSSAGAAWAAQASLWEAAEKLYIELDAPGVDAQDVDVTVENGQLAITVERSAGEALAEYIYNERRFGKVTRSLDLPDTVDPGSVEAELKNGVLRVSIAKRPETQPRKIDVRQG